MNFTRYFLSLKYSKMTLFLNLDRTLKIFITFSILNISLMIIILNFMEYQNNILRFSDRFIGKVIITFLRVELSK